MTSQTEKQFLAEQREQAVQRIKEANVPGREPVVFTEADERRLQIAIQNIPLAGMPDPRVPFNVAGKNAEDLALFLLGYGAAYSEALRNVERLRDKVRDLENERKVVRDFFRGDDA